MQKERSNKEKKINDLKKENKVRTDDHQNYALEKSFESGNQIERSSDNYNQIKRRQRVSIVDLKKIEA